MKKLLLLPTILVLVSCQPSELDRCIEANMPVLNESQRKDIIDEMSYSYGDPVLKIVFPDETSKEQLKWFALEDGWNFRIVADLYNGKEYYDSLEADEINVRGITKEIENFKNVYDYNIEYYGLSVDLSDDLETYLKKTATRRCNKQGIY